MKNKRFLLLIASSLILLSSCDSSSSLYGDNLLKLSADEVFSLSKEVLLNRVNVKKLVNSKEKKEYEISETVHLNSQINNYSYNCETLVYENNALSSSSTLKTTNSITATGFTTSSVVNKTFSSWIMSRNEEYNVYSRYSYLEESYNKGYKNTSYDVDDEIFTYDEIETNWTVYKLSYLFSNLDFDQLFSSSNNLVFVRKNKDTVIAYHTNQEIEMVVNPLYPYDETKKLPTLSIDTQSYTFSNNSTFGYVLKEVKFINQKKLLENFSNKYLSSPKLIYETEDVYEYTYGTSLPTYTLPNINDGLSASFTPLISSFDSEGNFINVTLKENVVNMTSVYQKDYPSFKGYAYSIPLNVSDTSLSYSFTARDNLALVEPIYNQYGYDYIDLANIPSGLISELEDNRFQINICGEYYFFLLYSSEYDLVSATLQIIDLNN
ncbi:MAG: hypothetical protein ACI31G_02480 [Bacilli bacterium]